MHAPLPPYLRALVGATALLLPGCVHAGTPTSQYSGAIASNPPGVVGPCANADTRLTPSRRERYRRLVGAVLADHAGSNGVHVEQFMRIDDWSLVRAATPFWAPGWFVFEETDATPRFRDLWNGMGPRGSREDLVAWATALGAPAGFVQCFADTVMK